MQNIRDAIRVRSGAVYLVLILIIVSTLALINAIASGFESQEKIQTYSDTVEVLSGVISGNVRTLAMVQRELLRLMVLIEDNEPDSDGMELQRSFVAQRMSEATNDIQRQTVGDEELFQQNLELVEIWTKEINPRVLLYIANPNVPDEIRDVLLEDMRELEVGFNRITAAAEINRESESTGLNEIALALLADIERLIGTLILTLVGFAALSVVSSGIFSQFARFRVESTSRIMSLLRETKKLSQVASRISNLVVITDPSGLIEWVNNAFIQRSGYTPQELINHRLDKWFSDTGVLQNWKDALETGKSFTEETVALTKSGDEYAVLVGVQPSYDDEGNLVNYIVVMTDITEIKKVENALRLSEKQLRNSLAQERELNQIKSRFVSMTSHEFRTPIAIISAAAESLQAFYERMNEEQRKSRFDRIQDQVQHMTHMLDDILLINRIEEGKLALNLEIFQLNGFITSIVDEFRSAKTTQNLDVHLRPEDITIIADRTLIRQIVSNLVSNAIKYSPADSTVTMTMQRDGEHAVITVRDQGIGIPLADQEHLFEAFHRADNVGKIKGTGLGLSIAKRAIDMHKGEILFSSEEGKGTEFIVRLPLKQRKMGGVTRPLASAADAVSDTGTLSS